MAYDNTNSGAAFPNDKKTSVRSPDFKGSINVNGAEYWLSVWVKKAGPNAKNPGQKFLSMSVTPKDDNWQRPASDLSTEDPLAGYGDTDDPTRPSNASDLPEPKFPEIPEDDNFSF